MPEKRGNLNELTRCAALCNGAVVSKKTEEWNATGEPTEVPTPQMNLTQIALQIFAAKSGFFKSVAVVSLQDMETFKDGVRYKHVQEHHFDSTVKRMTVIYHDLECQTNIAFMKGAAERVLDACSYNAQGVSFDIDRN